MVDPASFRWTDEARTGVSIEGQVLYELHLGTYTPEGTWRSAERELPSLRDVGVTVVEVMPVAEFPGRFGWGYDGVDLFAPYHQYGEPDDPVDRTIGCSWSTWAATFTCRRLPSRFWRLRRDAAGE